LPSPLCHQPQPRHCLCHCSALTRQLTARESRSAGRIRSVITIDKRAINELPCSVHEEPDATPGRFAARQAFRMMLARRQVRLCTNLTALSIRGESFERHATLHNPTLCEVLRLRNLTLSLRCQDPACGAPLLSGDEMSGRRVTRTLGPSAPRSFSGKCSVLPRLAQADPTAALGPQKPVNCPSGSL
jgi:hypothetical protein